MNTSVLLERYLHRVLRAAAEGAPPRLAAAMQHALFPAGARIRPRLCLAVARACGAEYAPAAMVAAAAIEFLHCASLAHDDLPCFDNANTRRGRPSVHRAHGERLAVLTGDALIVLAFQAVAQDCNITALERLQILQRVAAAVGIPRGIAAGQAQECEPEVRLPDYDQCKTGAMFVAATTLGALTAGADPADWVRVGECVGEAYQVADDICDVASSAEVLGKPIGRDAELDRPNAVDVLGMQGAQARLTTLVEAAIASIPECVGARELQARFLSAAQMLLSSRLARPAA